jgi:Family of unknown function (DUF5677)
MGHSEREAERERQARALIELATPHLPESVRVGGPVDAWALTGPALIARQIGSLDALAALRPLDRQADAIVVLRSLYEHAVTFAWMAADPSEDRLERFLKTDAVARLKAADDARSVGVKILDDGNQAVFEKQKADLPNEMPPLDQRATAADKHWSGKVRGLEVSSETKSYRGLYAIAYRHHSAIAHPSLMGLNLVTVDLPDGSKKVQPEVRDPDFHGPYGLGVVLFGFSLYIAGQALPGWPEEAEIDDVFESA